MKKCSFIFLFVALTAPLTAQNYTRSGYIVLVSGDTIHGFIKDMEWTINPASIEFQQNKESPFQVYDVQRLRGFATTRPIAYEVHKVKYDADDQTTSRLPYSREPETIKEETLFLEVVIRGGTTLLRLDDQLGRIHFFIQQKGSNQPIELENRTYLVTVNNIKQARQFAGWKQQLLNMSTDCKSLAATINNSKYAEIPLQKIIQSINKCRGEEMSVGVVTEAEKKPAQFGVMAQLFFDYSEINNAFTEFGSVNFAGGISYEFFSKKRPHRNSYYHELKYKRVAQQGKTFTGIPVDFEINSVRMINTLRFNYLDKKIPLFWNIGTNIGYRFNTTVKYDSGTDFPGKYESGLEIGLIVGTGGIVINQPKFKGTIELRYELEQAPFGNTSFVGSHALGLVFGAKF